MKHRKFTLIELLMVILVIAILLSLLFPSFGRAYHLAKHAKCISGQKQYYTTLALYSKNNKSSTPVFSPTWGASKTSFIWDVHRSFYTALMRYTPTDVFHCSYVKDPKHAFNNPANTCPNESGRIDKLGVSTCKGLMFWGNSITKGNILDGRPLALLDHNSPFIETHSKYDYYDQARSFDQINPSRPLISDTYYSYKKNGNTSFNIKQIHRYTESNLFGQVNGDGSGITAKEAQLYLLKINTSSLPSTAGFYGIP